MGFSDPKQHLFPLMKCPLWGTRNLGEWEMWFRSYVAEYRIFAVRVSFLTFRENVLEIHEDFLGKKPVCLHMRPFNEVVFSKPLDQPSKFSLIEKSLVESQVQLKRPQRCSPLYSNPGSDFQGRRRHSLPAVRITEVKHRRQEEAWAPGCDAVKGPLWC